MIHHTVSLACSAATYPVYIGEGLLADAAVLSRHIHGKQVLIVTQAPLAETVLPSLLSALSAYTCDVFLLPDGETAKSVTQWQAILDKLIQTGHDRSTTLIALGGGVVGDVTGFAAACYQRGVNYLQIPTTLIAQVDAAIGGKTAVNHPQGKNLIGAFHQPQCVLIDVSFLQTLSRRDYRAGLAEVLKAGLIADAEFFHWLMAKREALLQRQTDVLLQAIQRAVRIKVDIVMGDEHDHGRRNLLNFGHTFGHALEAAGDFQQYLHGEAVAIGMGLATVLSQQLELIPVATMQEVLQVLRAFGFGLGDALPSRDSLLAFIQRDKKVLAGQVQMILLTAIGHAVKRAVTTAELTVLIEESAVSFGSFRAN